MNAIGKFVTRDLHASASVRQLVRHVRAKLHPNVLRREQRTERHRLMRAALAAHESNYWLFVGVTSGAIT